VFGSRSGDLGALGVPSRFDDRGGLVLLRTDVHALLGLPSSLGGKYEFSVRLVPLVQTTDVRVRSRIVLLKMSMGPVAYGSGWIRPSLSYVRVLFALRGRIYCRWLHCCPLGLKLCTSFSW